MIKLLTADSRGVWDVEIEGSWTTSHVHLFPKAQVMATGITTFVYCSWCLFLFSDKCNSHLGVVCTVTAIWTTRRGPCETGLETGKMWCPREMRGRHNTVRDNYMSLKPMILTGIAACFCSCGVLIILYVWNMKREAFPVITKLCSVSSGGATVALRSFILRNFILMGKVSFHLINV